MKTKFFILLLCANIGTAFPVSFAGFDATSGSTLGNQIYYKNLIQNKNNVTLEETDNVKHKYNINLIDAGIGSFTMGDIKFSYKNSEAGKTAYKTYDAYIQPNGADREITIPTLRGEQVKVVLVEDCYGILVDGISTNLKAGDNILTSQGQSMVLKSTTAKPKISAILSLGGGYSIEKIGDLYYVLDISTKTAEVTYQEYYSLTNYSGLVDVDIPAQITFDNITYSVTSIGEWAFRGCSSLRNVEIPNSVKTIGAYAFSDCSGLTSVTLMEEIPPTLLEDGHFNNCFNLSNVYVPCGAIDVYKSSYDWYPYVDIVKYMMSPYTIIVKEPVNGTISVPESISICDDSVVLTAIPDRGSYFVKWLDGNTDNPRTMLFNKNLNVGAIFDYLLTGKCGRDNALTWTFDPFLMELNISDEGALSENYTYGTFMESLTIGNGITQIGQSAFAECTNLKKVIIGSSVKVLDEYAFYGCSAIESIICYSQRPPTVNNYALYGLDYNTIVYVSADYLDNYKMHDAWGLFDIRPLGATSTETNDIKVTPSENTAEVIWPVVSGAATYELVIKDKNGDVICSLLFNAQGQLIQLVFNAPARNKVPQMTQTNGFAFTVTGLESGTSYDLIITAKSDKGTTLESKTISFTTTSTSAIDNMNNVDYKRTSKVMRDGNIYILHNNKTYTLLGQKVK